MKTNRLVAIVVAILAAALAALFFAPGAPALGDPDGDTGDTGDAELARRVRDLVPDDDGFRGLAVATVEDGRVRFAGLGDAGDGRPVTADTPFENGSVTKVYTAMLFADMVARGEVRADRHARRPVARPRVRRPGGGVGDPRGARQPPLRAAAAGAGGARRAGQLGVGEPQRR